VGGGAQILCQSARAPGGYSPAPVCVAMLVDLDLENAAVRPVVCALVARESDMPCAHACVLFSRMVCMLAVLVLMHACAHIRAHCCICCVCMNAGVVCERMQLL